MQNRAMISVFATCSAPLCKFLPLLCKLERIPRPRRESLQMPSSTALGNEDVQAIRKGLCWNVRSLIFNLHISLGNREIKGTYCNSTRHTNAMTSWGRAGHGSRKETVHSYTTNTARMQAYANGLSDPKFSTVGAWLGSTAEPSESFLVNACVEAAGANMQNQCDD